MKQLATKVFLIASISGCSDADWKRPSAPPVQNIEVAATFEPLAPSGGVASVMRIDLVSSQPLPPGLALFSGTLRPSDLKALVANAPSKSLDSRKVPIVFWDQDSITKIAPTIRLTPGELYSVTVPSLGWAESFTVSEWDDAPFLQRMWPPQAESATAALAIWCLGDWVSGKVDEQPQPLQMWPGGIDGELIHGSIDGIGTQCIHWRALGGEPPQPLVPPRTAYLADGTLARIDPTPLAINRSPLIPSDPSCSPEERAFGPGCALVQDDRIIVTSRGSSWWMGIRTPANQWAGPLNPSHPMVLRPLTTDAPTEFVLKGVDVAGIEFSWGVAVKTTPSQLHVVLNEVMANPTGPEPEQEWNRAIERRE